MAGRYVEIPIKLKLSKLLLCLSVWRFKHSIWFEIKFWWGLYEQFRNHFLFLKLTTTERVSLLVSMLLLLIHISLRMYRRSPLRFPFLSYLYGTLKPFIWNWAVRKESSSFVSDIRSTSILLSIMYAKCLKLVSDWINIKITQY